MAIADKLKKLFGPDSMARQFFMWNVLGSVVNSALAPMYQAVANQANSSNPNIPMSPALLSDMVVRTIIGADWAEGEARKSGVHPNLFKLMVQNTGEPPSILDMLQLFRRGKIDRDTLIRAIHQSRIKEEWIDEVLKMGMQPPTPADILDALLQGQVDKPTATLMYQQLGGDPEYFQLLYDTRGSAPTPNEAGEMARKGIIPWEGSGPGVVSFEQAFLEGPWRNKWLPAWRRNTEYLPPPRTITAMLREGSLTVARAKELLTQQGVPADLVGTYLTDASATKTTTAKQLTESVVSNLYQDHALTDADALKYLKLLKYTDEEAHFVLLSWQLARDQQYTKTAISTVHTQYVNHKIDNAKASVLLDQFKVAPAQRDRLIKLWALEESAKVAILSPAQIKAAMTNNSISAQEAMTRMQNQGYSELDAAILLGLLIPTE